MRHNYAYLDLEVLRSFPDGAGVECARGTSRCALLPEIKTVRAKTKRRESRAAIRFIGGSLL